MKEAKDAEATETVDQGKETMTGEKADVSLVVARDILLEIVEVISGAALETEDEEVEEENLTESDFPSVHLQATRHHGQKVRSKEIEMIDTREHSIESIRAEAESEEDQEAILIQDRDQIPTVTLIIPEIKSTTVKKEVEVVAEVGLQILTDTRRDLTPKIQDLILTQEDPMSLGLQEVKSTVMGSKG